MGKNWKLRSFVVSVSVVRNTSLFFTTTTKTEREKKKKGGASKHFNDENKRETSTADLWLLQNLRGQTQTLPVTPSPPFFGLGVGFGYWWWVFGLGFFLKKGTFCFPWGTALHQQVTSSAGQDLQFSGHKTLFNMIGDNLNSPILLSTRESSRVYSNFLMIPQHLMGSCKYIAQSTVSHA